MFTARLSSLQRRATLMRRSTDPTWILTTQQSTFKLSTARMTLGPPTHAVCQQARMPCMMTGHSRRVIPTGCAIETSPYGRQRRNHNHTLHVEERLCMCCGHACDMYVQCWILMDAGVCTGRAAQHMHATAAPHLVCALRARCISPPGCGTASMNPTPCCSQAHECGGRAMPSSPLKFHYGMPKHRGLPPASPCVWQTASGRDMHGSPSVAQLSLHQSQRLCTCMGPPGHHACRDPRETRRRMHVKIPPTSRSPTSSLPSQPAWLRPLPRRGICMHGEHATVAMPDRSIAVASIHHWRRPAGMPRRQQ